MIIMKQIQKNFGDKTVLKGLDLSVDKGSIYGLLGPSGSGKTTLINIMIGKVQNFSGDLIVMNHNKQQLNEKSFKNKVGIMSDTSSAYSRLTVEENLSFFASLYKVKEDRVTSIMKELLLYDNKREIYKNLSKGMKQRVLLGIALINEPQLLILDEPTSALDPKTTKKIHNIITDLNKGGATIFLTTHDMEEAEKLCDQISILHNGKIKVSGPPMNIIKRKKRFLINTEKNNHLIYKDNNLHNRLNDIMKKEKIIDINTKQQNLRDDFIEITKELGDE